MAIGLNSCLGKMVGTPYTTIKKTRRITDTEVIIERRDRLRKESGSIDDFLLFS